MPCVNVWRAGLLVVLMLFAAAGRASDCPPAATPSLVLKATRAALARGERITIIALGSSSTEGVGASRPDRAYPARLQALLRTFWPRGGVTVLNLGVGGQTTADMLDRLDRDVLEHHPTLVIWQDGANAALRGIEPARFNALLDEGVRRIAASGADLVLMDNQFAPKLTAMPGSGVYDEIVGRVAEARHVSLFSRATLMRQWVAADPLATGMIGADGVHHTDRGYACVAASLAQAIRRAVGVLDGVARQAAP